MKGAWSPACHGACLREVFGRMRMTPNFAQTILTDDPLMVVLLMFQVSVCRRDPSSEKKDHGHRLDQFSHPNFMQTDNVGKRRNASLILTIILHQTQGSLPQRLYVNQASPAFEALPSSRGKFVLEQSLA